LPLPVASDHEEIKIAELFPKKSTASQKIKGQKEKCSLTIELIHRNGLIWLPAICSTQEELTL